MTTDVPHGPGGATPAWRDALDAFLGGLTPDDCGRAEIERWVVRFEGFSGLCLSDVDRRMALPSEDPDHVADLDAALDDAIEDLMAREGRPCLESGVLRGEEPIVYVIFPAAPGDEPDQAPT